MLQADVIPPNLMRSLTALESLYVASSKRISITLRRFCMILKFIHLCAGCLPHSNFGSLRLTELTSGLFKGLTALTTVQYVLPPCCLHRQLSVRTDPWVFGSWLQSFTDGAGHSPVERLFRRWRNQVLVGFKGGTGGRTQRAVVVTDCIRINGSGCNQNV